MHLTSWTGWVGLVILILSAIGGYWLLSPTQVHHHAGFQVYVNGQLQDYSGNQYMHQEVCQIGDDGGVDRERIDLHNNEGSVVHVHHRDAAWRDLFNHLNLSLDGTVAAYINSQPVDNVSSTKINLNDRLVLLIDTPENHQQYLNEQITIEQIREAERFDEDC